MSGVGMLGKASLCITISDRTCTPARTQFQVEA